MDIKDNSSQEKIYSTINKTLSDALKIIKFLIYPLSLIFIFIVIFWGVDIINLNNDLNNIKNGLELKLKEIELKQRETNLVAEEKLKLLNEKLITIDSSFAVLEDSYNQALNESNKELFKLKANSKKLSEFSNTIESSISSAIERYKNVQKKYSSEIEYASKGAEQRKKDIEAIFRQSRTLLINLAEIIENTTTYIEENSKGSIVDDTYDFDKIKLLKEKLKLQLDEFRKKLNRD